MNDKIVHCILEMDRRPIHDNTIGESVGEFHVPFDITMSKIEDRRNVISHLAFRFSIKNESYSDRHIHCTDILAHMDL